MPAADLPRHATELTEPQERALAGRIAGQEAARYAEAHRSAVAWLDRSSYFALLDALDGLRARPPLRPGRSRRPAGTHLRKVAARNHRRLSRWMRTAAGAPAGPRRDRALHQARKAVRRARHSAEAALPCAGKRANKYRKRAKAVQEVLGAHQDAVVARAELPDLAARARPAGSGHLRLRPPPCRAGTPCRRCARRPCAGVAPAAPVLRKEPGPSRAPVPPAPVRRRRLPGVEADDGGAVGPGRPAVEAATARGPVNGVGRDDRT